MWKKLTYLAIFLVLVSFTYADLIVRDSFEDGDYTNDVAWYVQSGTGTVNAGNAAYGTYKLNYSGASGNNQIGTIKLFNNTEEDVYISLWLYFESTTNDFYLMLKSNNATDGTYCDWLVFGHPGGDDGVGYRTGAAYVDTGTNYVAQTWFEIKGLYNATLNRITDMWLDDVAIPQPSGDVDDCTALYGLYSYDLKLGGKSLIDYVTFNNTLDTPPGGPAQPSITWPSITQDTEVIGIYDYWTNWSIVGNYTTVVGYIDGSIVFNSSIFEYNFTGLINLTNYIINLSIMHNSTVYNNTLLNITTNQLNVGFYQIYSKVLENQALLNTIIEVLNMLGIVFVWAFLNIAAFSLLQKGQYLAGWWIYGFASFFDLFLSGYLINTYQSIASGSSFYGLTASFLMVACSVWIIVRVAIPFTYKTYIRR